MYTHARHGHFSNNSLKVLLEGRHSSCVFASTVRYTEYFYRTSTVLVQYCVFDKSNRVESSRERGAQLLASNSTRLAQLDA